MDVGAPSNYERMVAMTGRFTGGAGNSQGMGDGNAVNAANAANANAANVTPNGGHMAGGVSDSAGAADRAMSGAVEALRREIAGWASSDDDIRRAIRELHDRYGYISDPHGAAGYNALKGLGMNGFWLSTASPAKFGEVIEPVLGLSPEVPERLARLTSLPKISIPIAPDSEALKEFVASLPL
jgi:threonine synthase